MSSVVSPGGIQSGYATHHFWMRIASAFHITQVQAKEALDVSPIKGYHPLRFRSAYGDVSLRSPRWHRCGCEQSAQSTFCPLNAILTTHTAPDLEFLEAKWAAKVSFAAVAEFLKDVLPVDGAVRPETIRQHVSATAERLGAELGPEQFMYDSGCQRDIEASPEPGPTDHGRT
jgi:hypothetical protein